MTTIELWQSGVTMAKSLARKKARTVSSFLGDCSEDFEQAALLALWKAAQLYQENNGATFLSFAWHHIRGELNCERWRQETFGFKYGKAVAYKKTAQLNKLPESDIPDDIVCEVDESVDDHDNNELLVWMIDQVPFEKARIVAQKYWLNGLPTRVIAQQMCLSTDRIEQLRSKAKHELERIAAILINKWEKTDGCLG